jgi:hypothetical protein
MFWWCLFTSFSDNILMFFVNSTIFTLNHFRNAVWRTNEEIVDRKNEFDKRSIFAKQRLLLYIWRSFNSSFQLFFVYINRNIILSIQSITFKFFKDVFKSLHLLFVKISSIASRKLKNLQFDTSDIQEFQSSFCQKLFLIDLWLNKVHFYTKINEDERICSKIEKSVYL